VNPTGSPHTGGKKYAKTNDRMKKNRSTGKTFINKNETKRETGQEAVEFVEKLDSTGTPFMKGKKEGGKE